MGTLYREVGSTYELPSHGFSAPEGRNYGGTKVGSATARLYLDSGTVVEVLLSAREGETLSVDDVEATFAVAGKEPVIALRKDGRISVRVDDLSAYQLDVPLSIVVGGKRVISFSALSYANLVVGNASGAYDEVAKDALCALYHCFEASTAYLG